MCQKIIAAKIGNFINILILLYKKVDLPSKIAFTIVVLWFSDLAEMLPDRLCC